MHAAPPVRMALAQDQAWRVFVSLCAVTAAANTAAWAALHWQASAEVAGIVAISTAVATGATAWLLTCRGDAVRGVLAWDGATWRWSQGSLAPRAGEVRVMLDLGAWLLLRFSPEPPTRRAFWLPLSRADAGPHWSAWRAALYARRPEPDAHSMPDWT